MPLSDGGLKCGRNFKIHSKMLLRETQIFSLQIFFDVGLTCQLAGLQSASLELNDHDTLGGKSMVIRGQDARVGL